MRRLYRGLDLGRSADERRRDLHDLWHEDAEWRPAFTGGGLVEGAVYRGHEGLLEYLERQAETWESVSGEAVDIREVGAHLVVETRIHAVGRGSGVPVTQVTWNVFEIHDGKIASGRVCTDRQQAFEFARAAE
ncbi:MAG: nuclear transport factor 2 family protein [Solirubrobacterales bacterium]